MDDKLIEYFATKDITCLHAWVEENYKMFHHIVHKTIKEYGLFGMDEEDLFSEAIIIFYGIVDKYDPQMSQFSTYIYKAISNELLNKLKATRNHDFQRRVDTVDLDDILTSEAGKVSLREETISVTDPNELMNKVMVNELRELVATHCTPRKQEIYRLYSTGMSMTDIATMMGATKQYVFSVIQDIVALARKEWQVND